MALILHITLIILACATIGSAQLHLNIESALYSEQNTSPENALKNYIDARTRLDVAEIESLLYPPGRKNEFTNPMWIDSVVIVKKIEIDHILAQKLKQSPQPIIGDIHFYVAHYRMGGRRYMSIYSLRKYENQWLIYSDVFVRFSTFIEEEENNEMPIQIIFTPLQGTGSVTDEDKYVFTGDYGNRIEIDASNLFYRQTDYYGNVDLWIYVAVNNNFKLDYNAASLKINGRAIKSIGEMTYYNGSIMHLPFRRDGEKIWGCITELYEEHGSYTPEITVQLSFPIDIKTLISTKIWQFSMPTFMDCESDDLFFQSHEFQFESYINDYN